MTDEEKNGFQEDKQPVVEHQPVVEGEVLDGAPGTGDEALSEAAFQQLVQELEQSQAKAQEYSDGWQRERADFANYKRRIERDQQANAQTMKSDLIKKYLPVLDDMDRAFKNRPADGDTETWVNGIELIYRKLQNILEAEGVKRIQAEAEEFNPNCHEAITYEESSEHTSGQIIEVIQQGYTLGERVLRPALVRVAR